MLKCNYRMDLSFPRHPNMFRVRHRVDMQYPLIHEFKDALVVIQNENAFLTKHMTVIS